MKYRKKPIEVEAIQYTGDNLKAVRALGVTVDQIAWNNAFSVWIVKSQAWGLVEPGDWLIAEDDGEGVYPCKDETFRVTYEEVTDVDA